MPSRSELVTVIPAPALRDRPDGSYVRGVPGEGRTMTREEAQPLLDAGLVIIKPDRPAPKED